MGGSGGADDNYLDLAHLRQLLGLLLDMDVAEFEAPGIKVAFKTNTYDSHLPLKGRTVEQVLVDEDRSTSSKPVRGFSDSGQKDVWHNPALWAGQSGKVLKFDGSFE